MNDTHPMDDPATPGQDEPGSADGLEGMIARYREPPVMLCVYRTGCQHPGECKAATHCMAPLARVLRGQGNARPDT